PSVTKDGRPITLQINAGLLVDLPALEQSGATGIGLFRTELQFMISSTLPRLDRQMEIYKTVIESTQGKPVVFRSLDIGGDKMLPYMRHAPEANPALGWRAVRMALDRPGLFRTQIRALLRAAAGTELRVMIPMVAQCDEFEAAKALVERERWHLQKHGHALPERILLGAMLEVPSLLWQLDRLLPLADFVSVGSNDLLQFMFAADRGNMRVADRFDPLSLPVLRALKHIADEGKRFDTPVSLCGEMAGRPLEAMALAGLGFRTISMAPASVGPIKAMIRSLDLGALEIRMTALLAGSEGDCRGALSRFAEQAEVEI
ncbi:MAG: putative PEP-binding protein, partial [Pseudomonadota bacterium]|nr:putative PEP-binding protein [Pseudomonadota bacterium]